MSEEKWETRESRAERLHLEPSAISDVWLYWGARDEPYGASEGEVETSKAISLKRIADVLENVTFELDGRVPMRAVRQWDCREIVE